MFGGTRLKDLEDRFDIVENVVGINRPRIATVENKLAAYCARVTSLERTVDQLSGFQQAQPPRSPEGPDAATPGVQPLPPPAPADTAEEPITADLAIMAPLWVPDEPPAPARAPEPLQRPETSIARLNLLEKAAERAAVQ